MNKQCICILLNDAEEYDFEFILQRYLPEDRFDVTIAATFPDNPSRFQLIVPWNYKKVIKQAEQAGNVVIMHASNLPDGRGWAPIYYLFKEQKSEYVISGILAANEVDTGDVVVRARFPLEASYTASFIRKIDVELSVLLIARILELWPASSPKGVKQSGKASYRQRRCPSDNEINIDASLRDLLPHLRGVEAAHPAYFQYHGVKYYIQIQPDGIPKKPCVSIEYPAVAKSEIWNAWI